MMRKRLTESGALGALVPLARQPGLLPVIPVPPWAGSQGGVQYKGGKPVAIMVPNAESDESRVIRIHEALHAKYSVPPTSKPLAEEERMALEIWEDALIHGLHWVDDIGRSADEKDITRACWDVHDQLFQNILELPSVGKAEWNEVLAALARSVVVRRALGKGLTEPDKVRIYKKFGVTALDTLNNLAMGIHDYHNDKKWRDQIMAGLRKCMVPLEDLPPCEDSGSNGKKKLKQEMHVSEPARTEPCQPKIVKKRVYKPFGSRLNLGALTRFVTCFETKKLFVERKIRPGHKSVVVIDASGSMNVSPERLQALCRAIPGATVAYYSDYGERSRGPYGTLVVYAKNGKRLADHLGAPERSGGNNVDRAAIEWLIQEPGDEKFLVSDGGFCGGESGQDVQAHWLLSEHPYIEQIESIKKAWPVLVGEQEPDSVTV